MSLVQLPEDEGALLRSLRETDRRLFLIRVRALIDAGWPLRAVGEPFNTGRSTVRAWKLAATEATNKDLEALPSVPTRSRLKVVRLRPDVPEEERDHLVELAQQARSVNRWTPPTAPERRASQELNELLQLYVNRGVPIRTLADRLGVTYRAVVARLERQQQQSLDKAAV
jgi:hypothetical protein